MKRQAIRRRLAALRSEDRRQITVPNVPYFYQRERLD